MRRLMSMALERAGNLIVENYVVGLGLAGVKLSDGYAGVAYNLRGDLLGECEEFYRNTESGDFEPPLKAGMRAEDFIRAVSSRDPISRSLGIAALNAVLNRDSYQTMDVLEYLDIGPDDVVGMIGNIKPFAFEIMLRARELMIFERNRKGEELPDWMIASDLEKCSVVIISASTVVNWTIEWILDYVKTDRVAIVGPSAPMVRDVFPVGIIGGARVLDPDRTLDILARGGGTKSIYSSGAAEKVSLILR